MNAKVLSNITFKGPRDLLESVKLGSIQRAEQLLKDVSQPLCTEDAGWLLHFAVQTAPLHLFQAIVEKCRNPQALFQEQGHVQALEGRHTLTETAAYYDRVDVLEFLLQCGATLFPQSPDDVTPLEAAIRGGARDVLTKLLNLPGMDPLPTPRLFRLYAQVPARPEIAECCTLAAPRILGQPFCMTDQGPLPSQLRLSDILDAQNWVLMIRYCMRPVPRAEGKQILERMHWAAVTRDASNHLPTILSALLHACPELIRFQSMHRLLIGCALQGERDIPAEILPYLEQIQRSDIEIRQQEGFRWCGPHGLLIRWRSRLGSSFVPVLNRKNPFPAENPTPEEISHTLGLCKIIGTPKSGQISPLFEDVLNFATPAVLKEAFASSQLMADEDLDLLKSLCHAGAMYISKENQKFLISHFKWEGDLHA